MNQEERRKQLKTRILDLLAKGKSLRAACQKAGISRVSVGKWRSKDPTFGARVQEYLELKLPGNLVNSEEGESVVLAASPDAVAPSTIHVQRPLVVESPGGCLTPIRTEAELGRYRRDVGNAEYNRAARERRRRLEEFDPMRHGL
jgi:hypothetical protein